MREHSCSLWYSGFMRQPIRFMHRILGKADRPEKPHTRLWKVTCALVALYVTVVSLLHLSPAAAEEQGGAEYQQWRERLDKAAKDHDAREELLAITTIGHRWNWAISTLPTRLIGQVLQDTEEG